MPTSQDAQLMLRQHRSISLGFLPQYHWDFHPPNKQQGHAKPHGIARTVAEFLSLGASTSLTVWACGRHLCRA